MIIPKMINLLKNKITNNFLKLQNFIFDALFPWHCVFCLKENENLICPECLKTIPLFSDFYCPSCQKILTSLKNHCHRKTRLYALGAVSCYENPVLRKAIYAFKYQKIIKLKEIFSNLIIQFLKQSKFFSELLKEKNNIIILSVPLHKARERKRGFNQADLLAQEISKSFEIPYPKNALLRKKNNLPQASLKDKTEREKNVRNIFKINPQKRKLLKNKIILLVDDVYTTGATMEEISKLLKKAKVKKIIGLVIAR